MLLRKLKIEIEAASSMHQASYPAMPCKEHGTTSYGLNTKHQHFRVKPSKEKMVEFVNYMNSLSLADGPLTTDVAKGVAASHGLDANTQQSKPPEAGLGAMAADTQEPPAHAGLGASPDGLNMDAAEPDPRKKNSMRVNLN